MQGRYGLPNTDWIADLNRARARLACRDGLEVLEVFQVCAVERVCVLGLRYANARQLRDQAELAHHQEAVAERADVAEVTTGQDDPVWHLPLELLHDLDCDGLLPFNSQAVHRIRQVDVLMLRDLLDGGHAAIEVGVQGKNQSPVRERLDELCR